MPWSIPAWNAVGATQQSPDISAVLQEVVDRGGWGPYDSAAFADGGTGGSAAVRVGFLAGDANQTRAVTLSDLLGVNAVLTQTLSAANYLRDVNVSGSLSVADLLFVSFRLTQVLPAP